jgi:hypothetical protein
MAFTVGHMADEDASSPTSAGATPSAADVARIESLVRRLDEMEAEVRRLAIRLDDTAAAQPVLDEPPAATLQVARPSAPVLHLALPNYLAMTLTQVDDLLLRRDVALHEGDYDAIRALDERISGLACAGLTRASDDLEVPSDMVIGPQHVRFLRRESTNDLDTGGLSVDEFREREIALLRMIGLSNDLATSHVDQSLNLVRTNDIVMRSRLDLLKAVRDAASGACRSHDVIIESRQTREKNRRRRLTLKRWAVALGGATIVAADMAGDALGGLGFLTAASATLGGGAAGAAANLIEE